MFGNSHIRSRLLGGSALGLAASLALAGAAEAQSFLNIGNSTLNPSVTINNNFTPVQAYDPTNITGIGQIITNNGNGTVGLCTGTLINRRTVIFAAHCVNSRAATAYGAGSGGVPIAVGFETNTRANAAGQPDELLDWFTGPNANRTNTAQAFYNMNQVYWHLGSVAPASCTNPTSCFLEADIAMGALDTPANNVPQWTMLFSPLPTPGSINPATGTGYHVGIAGYGAFGTGTTGAASGSNFRRRVAENMLGALTSINARNQFLFGTPGAPSRPQLLYWADFDDPRRGQAGADPDDFNGFRDNALAREGLTGPGDSGGPLILDQAFARPTVIGVLSGGSTFFNGQPGGSYGTQSFYQPLFLYWDWIAANNPYRYATARAGDGAWEDATRWVTELDPAYQIISGGQLVNGVPTNPGEGNAGAGPNFGELCFQSPSSSTNPPTNECQNLATGQARNNVPNNPNSADNPVEFGQITAGVESIQTVVDSAATVRIDQAGAGDEAQAGVDYAEDVQISGGGFIEGSIETPEVGGYLNTPNPAATLANGLPGATNFVPNNFDGVRATGQSARYYDITLRNAGTTTLSSTVVIDRFAVAGANSGLNVATGGSLTSLSDITQFAGRINVDGNLRSAGDYALIGGLLSGRGTVTTPFLTSVLGTVAPGAVGSIGTLTVAGNVVFSSGNQFAVDVGTTTSDLLRVIANGTSTGSANLGGIVNLNFTAAPTFGQQYTVLTATGGVTGQFAGVADLPGVLRPSISYTADTVRISIQADSFVNFANAGSPTQLEIGRLLDRTRTNNYAALSGLYGSIDLLEGQALGIALESLAPYTAESSSTLSMIQAETMTSLVSQRLSANRSGGNSEGLSLLGANGVQVAALDANLMPIVASVVRQDPERERLTGGWKHGASGFLSVAYTDGEAANLAGVTPIGLSNDDHKTWYVAGGLERTDDEGATLGISAAYSDGEAEHAGQNKSETTQMQLNAYARANLNDTSYAGAYVGYGLLDIDTERTATIGATTLRAQGKTDGGVLMAGFEIGDRRAIGGLTIVPHFGLDYFDASIDPYRETGSAGLAMDIGEVETSSAQAFLGIRIEGQAGSDSFPIYPALSLRGVSDLESDDDGFTAAFAGTGVAPGVFVGPGRDNTWGEVAGSVTMGGEDLRVTLQASSMIERDDIDYQTYRATVSMKF